MNPVCELSGYGVETYEFRIWLAIIQRCTNPGLPSWKRYGGRGVKVCDRWLTSFENFFMDMGYRPLGLTIERVDNDGPYSPENCIWATHKRQMRNTCRTVRVEHQGKKIALCSLFKTIKEARLASVRYHDGWPLENILSGERPLKTQLNKRPKFKRMDDPPEAGKRLPFILKKRAEEFSYRDIGDMLGITKQAVHTIYRNSLD